MTLVINVLLVLIGLFTLYVGVKGVIFGITSNGWPNTTGRITLSEVSHSDEGSAAKLSYSYSVKDKAFEGSRVGFSTLGTRWNAGDEKDANYLSNQYYKGKDVSVFYHPKYHSFAVLEPGFNKWSIAVIVLGILIIAATMMF